MFCRSSRPSFCRTIRPSRSRSYRSLSTVATSRELREAGRINNDLVLARNPPSRSEDKTGLTIELDGVFKTCRCFSFSLPCYRFSSSSSSIRSQLEIHPLPAITIFALYRSGSCLRDHRSSKTALLVEEEEEEEVVEATGSIPPCGVYLYVTSSASHDEDKVDWFLGAKLERQAKTPGSPDRADERYRFD